MNTQKIVHLALSLMIGGSLLTACGPAANAPGPNSTGNTANNNTGSSASSSAQLSAELQAIVADDDAFADSQTAADGSFSTQAIGIPRRGGPSLPLQARPRVAPRGLRVFRREFPISRSMELKP